MTLRIAIGAGAVLIGALLLTGILTMRRRRSNARSESFRERWQDIQKDCRKSDEWPTCVIEADKLLGDVLKASGFKGRTMGERLVAAQRSLSDNDSVWFAHKLCNKIVHEEITRLYKRDVQSALMGMRKALQDLGAL
jgi:hypothetical protein